MDASLIKASFDLNFAQIAWVVKDIAVSKKFFEDTMAIDLGKIGTIRAKDFEGTYYGKSSDGESLVMQVYSGGTFIEVIQPLSGINIFQDFLDKNPSGGVQHVAYRTPVANFDKVITEFENNGFQVSIQFQYVDCQDRFF